MNIEDRHFIIDIGYQSKASMYSSGTCVLCGLSQSGSCSRVEWHITLRIHFIRKINVKIRAILVGIHAQSQGTSGFRNLPMRRFTVNIGHQPTKTISEPLQQQNMILQRAINTETDTLDYARDVGILYGVDFE